MLYGLWAKNGFTFLNGGETQKKNILWHVKIIGNAKFFLKLKFQCSETHLFAYILSVAAFAAAKAELSNCDYMAYKA